MISKAFPPAVRPLCGRSLMMHSGVARSAQRNQVLFGIITRMTTIAAKIFPFGPT